MKKKERRPTHFQIPSMPRESANSEQPQSQSQQPEQQKDAEEFQVPPHVYDPNQAVFFVPNEAGAVQAVQYYEVEEEPDVSYSVALVSCMLSLAMGFGLGYGT